MEKKVFCAIVNITCRVEKMKTRKMNSLSSTWIKVSADNEKGKNKQCSCIQEKVKMKNNEMNEHCLL